MTKILGFADRNRLTVGMIVLTAFFYAFFMMADRSQTHPGKRLEIRQNKEAGFQALKTREDIFKKNVSGHPQYSIAAGLLFLTVFFAGLGIDFWLLLAFFRRRSWIHETVLPYHPPWGLADVLQIFVFMFFSEACIAFVEILLSSAFNLKGMGHDFFILLNSLLRDMCVALFVIYLVKEKFGENLSSVGLTLRSFFSNVKRGFAGYVAMIPVLALSLLSVALLAQLFSYEPMPQDVVQVYLKKSADKHILLLTFFVTVLGPVIEEIFFRGFTYRAFRGRFGVFGAAIATAAIFAAFHMNLMAFLPIFVLGLFLTYLYEKTGSLVPSITAHVTHNLVMVCLTLIFKSLSG